MSGTPTFALGGDGRHVTVEHQCKRPASWPPVRATLPLGPDGWTVTATDPLTVTPSVHCQECGMHGFITNGEWVAA